MTTGLSLVDYMIFNFPFDRVSVMGNNFTYNGTEFGKADVYTTIRAYLRTGKTFLSKCIMYDGCVKIQGITILPTQSSFIAKDLILTR